MNADRWPLALAAAPTATSRQHSSKRKRHGTAGTTERWRLYARAVIHGLK